MTPEEIEAMYSQAVIEVSNNGGRIPCIFAALVLENAATLLESLDWTKPHANAIASACAELRFVAKGLKP